MSELGDWAERELSEAPSNSMVDASGKLFVLPANHVPGLVVPKGGSSCANCRFGEMREDGPHCIEQNFAQWNGGTRLPVDDPETYCSDWWEPHAE